MITRPPRLVTGLAVGLGLGPATGLLGAGPATAHVSADKSEVPAGGFTAVTLTVGHGCDGSPTTSIAVEIPAAILDVTPAVHAGWDVAIENEALAEPVEGAHGDQVTERDAVVTYTAQAGNELPDGFRDSFTLGFQAPETPGETLYFKTVQTCAAGETAWIDEDPASETPSPAVPVAAADGGHDDGSDDEHADETTTTTTADAEADEEPAQEAAAETDVEDDDDDSSTGIAVAGLVVGTLGLLTGGAALATARRS